MSRYERLVYPAAGEGQAIGDLTDRAKVLSAVHQRFWYLASDNTTARQVSSQRQRIEKKAETKFFASAFLKGWRLPTLAESIRPLPSARLCLTAEFGMGSGRTTALWPPKIRGQSQKSEVKRNR